MQTEQNTSEIGSRANNDTLRMKVEEPIVKQFYIEVTNIDAWIIVC